MIKNIFLVFILLIYIPFSIKAQESTDFEQIVEDRISTLFKSLEKNDIKIVNKYLSKDLIVSGYDGDLAISILKSISMQINIPQDYKITSTKEGDNYKVIVTVEKAESQLYEFVFNKRYDFIEINMVEVQIQSAKQENVFRLDKPLTIPFNIIDNLIVFKLSINNHSKKLNFIFDTGATTCVLDSKLATKYELKTLSKQNAIGATGNEVYDIGSIKSIKIDKIILSNTTCVFVDLDHLKNRIDIDGIIGYSVLKNYAIKIDYDNTELIFYNNINECEKVYSSKLTFDLENTIPRTSLSITLKTGETYSGKVLLDSGARPNFVLNSNVVKEHNILEKITNKFVSTSTSLTGNEKQYEGNIENIVMDNISFFDVPISFSVSTKGVNSFSNLFGILGNGIMHRLNWIFDYKNNIAYYEKNKYFNEKFKYHSTNFSIVLKGENLFFENIQPNSKAALKGITDNTQILCVNGYNANDFEKIEKLLNTNDIPLKIKYLDKDQKKKILKVKTKNSY